MTEIARTTIGLNRWPNPKMEIRLDISSNRLRVHQRPKGSSVAWRSDGSPGSSGPIGHEPHFVFDAPMATRTGYFGFGPYVGYASHGCDAATNFTFSNIQMSYALQSDAIYDALNAHRYIQNSDKYLVDLTDNGVQRDVLSAQGAAAAGYMQAQDIKYITNDPADNGLRRIINSGMSTTGSVGQPEGKAPYGYEPSSRYYAGQGESGHGRRVETPEMTYPPNANNGLKIDNARLTTDPTPQYLDGLITQMAEYIVRTYIEQQEKEAAYFHPGYNIPVSRDEPVANLTVVSSLGATKGSQLQRF